MCIPRAVPISRGHGSHSISRLYLINKTCKSVKDTLKGLSSSYKNDVILE
jgi:hypothetical protein